MTCVVCDDKLDETTFVKKTSICTCWICEGCFYEHCTHLARNAPVSKFTCPGCSKPDVYANPDGALKYFSYLRLQIKARQLDDPLFKLIETKILDWKVQQIPDFYKCAHCELGFKFESRESPKSMTCTFCSKLTCYNCNNKYEAGHQCEEDDNCDVIPTIECSRCHQIYEHVASDCLHSVCLDKECLHEFCSSCQQPYYKPLEATDSQEKHGYQCDHSRNCLSKLRNYDVEDLLGLLQEHKMKIDTDAMTRDDKCTFITDGYGGSRACGQPSGDHGYCNNHYKDHLIRQINAARIDPVSAWTAEAMKEELRSKEKELPHKTGDDVEDTLRLRAAVKELPLTKITEQSMEITCDSVDFIVPFIKDPVRGLSCKHTRNCLASLRDYEIDDLLNLTQENKVDVQLDVKGTKCILIITDDSYKEMECGKDCHENYAYCLQHCKEHIISKINANHIDPINILDDQALKMELRSIGNEAAVEDGMSRDEMIKIIKEKVPLKRMSKPKLKVTSKNLKRVGSIIKNAQQIDREMAEEMLGMMGTRTTVCPQCKTKHEDMWNGSLRYTCPLCHIEYCSFCLKLFTRMQSSCSQNCERLGNHCHHPENCFYYLRDWEVENLQKSLKIIKEKVPLKRMSKPKLKVTSKNLKRVGSIIKNARQRDREMAEKMLEMMGTRTTVCPQCKTKHEDMWNGSLRYTCHLCHIEYCSFCLKLFTRMQSSCSQNCERLGNHCHHPKNCFYYLRDWEVEDLQKSLKDQNVPVPSKELAGRACRIVIEHDIKDHTKVILCKKRSFAGEICLEHYKETLARLICKHHIIPVASSLVELQILRTALNSENPSQPTADVRSNSCDSKDTCVLL